jgi:UDP-2,3-diacylglucosamine pyrophosphatase LpxH
MLVIASDLHLTDGTSGTTINSVAFKILKWRLEALAYAASCRMVGSIETYEPIDDIYLLLLGDILDTIRSTEWLRGEGEDKVRPWDDDPIKKQFVTKVRTITEKILQWNQPLLEVFRHLKEHGVNVPDKADPVKVHIYYLVGNHDWFYHLPYQEYDAIRNSIICALGLADDHPRDLFPYDTDENPTVRKICRAHHVFGRHGDIFDRNNFQLGDRSRSPLQETMRRIGRSLHRFGHSRGLFDWDNYKPKDRNRSSLGDAIVIELVDRFADKVKQDLGASAPRGLEEIDNVRPVELVPAWVNGLLGRSKPEVACQVRDIWNKVVEDFLKVPFVEKYPSIVKRCLRLSEGWFALAALGRIVPALRSLVTSAATISPRLDKKLFRRGYSGDLYIGALDEPVFRNRDPEISYIVYGHSHHHEIVPLQTATEERRKAAYLNAGTWRAVFELARSRPKDEEFFGYHVMTYLCFFKDDEREDGKFETWSSSLESPIVGGPPGLLMPVISPGAAA